MPGLELNALSSNWKILQKRLQAGKKSDAQSQALKRKQADSNSETNYTNSQHGKRKYTEHSTKHVDSSKRRKMGSYISRPNGEDHRPTETDTEKPSTSRQSLSNGRPSTSRDEDLINQGLHPTNKPGKYLGLDCEMVGTGPPPHLDHVLARVSLVNYHGEQLYDSYVLPPKNIPIHDYRTFVSGIRPEHLKPGIARPFPEVQKAVGALLQDKILVGHALKNDLEVLMLGHPKRDIRDTARFPAYRKFSMGKSPGLKKLAKIVLGREIQDGEHSSVEDARAAMELFKCNKEGFEVLVRQRYGAGGAKGGKGRIVEKDQLTQRVVDDEEEEEEEGDDEEDGAVKEAAKPKRKKKSKKRTKRA